ncbi:type 4 pilus major pilin [Herbaspirillum huttiense]|jgi:type II secretory pathway pseudopilin PulG|uniref:type 4 pilus major pilin n=1 Tax=Herbaspirillum huttiense TaxID=863372 RepID=UPI003817F768
MKMQRNFQRQKKLRRQEGWTLVELMFVLMIMLAGAAGVVWKFDLLGLKSDINDELSNINMIEGGIKSIRSSGGYGASGTDLLPILKDNQQLPTNMSYVGGELTNTWGGVVQAISTGAGHTLSYAGVPKGACSKLAQMISRGRMFKSVSINGASPLTGELDGAAAGANCANETNTVLWTTSN